MVVSPFPYFAFFPGKGRCFCRKTCSSMGACLKEQRWSGLFRFLAIKYGLQIFGG